MALTGAVGEPSGSRRGVEPHDDRGLPEVVVGVESGVGEVRVSVADDGPDVPALEREAVTALTETDLEHSNGLGLWLAKWAASLSGGDLSFSENDPRGSVVTLALPAVGGDGNGDGKRVGNGVREPGESAGGQ